MEEKDAGEQKEEMLVDLRAADEDTLLRILESVVKWAAIREIDEALKWNWLPAIDMLKAYLQELEEVDTVHEVLLIVGSSFSVTDALIHLNAQDENLERYIWYLRHRLMKKAEERIMEILGKTEGAIG